MNIRKRSIAALFIVAAMAAMIAGAQEKPIKPKRDQVVFIAKLRTQPSLPVDFFRSYIKTGKRGESPTTGYASLGAKNAFLSATMHSLGQLNQFGYFSVQPNKDRTFWFDGLKIYLFDIAALSISIPLHVEITVPKDVQFVYLGSFVYKYSDEYFTKSELVRLDEFDEVLSELKAAFGPGVELIRATFKEAR